MKVVVSKQAWGNFVRRAKRRFPKEHVEVIYGTEMVDSFRIAEFHEIQLIKATHKTLDYERIDIERHKWLATQTGLDFLGTVHTHPHKDFDTSPSERDHTWAVEFGERLMGIVHLFRKQERFTVNAQWWVPQDPLDFVLLPE